MVQDKISGMCDVIKNARHGAFSKQLQSGPQKC